MLTVQADISSDFRHLLLGARGNERDLRALLMSGGIESSRAGGAVAVPARASASALQIVEREAALRASDNVRRFAENRRGAFAAHPQLLADVRMIRDAGPGYAADLLSDVDVKRLDGHQVVNVAAGTLEGCYGLCLFDEQGAGKTVSGIFVWDTLVQRRQIDRLVVVSPKAMVAEWERDLERFAGGLYRTTQVVGSRREKRQQLRTAADVYVTNFETAISLQADLIALARGGDRRTLLIVDESFLVKNPEAARSRALRQLREWCARCLVLCGTPAPNSAADLVGQFDLADLGVCFDGIRLSGDRERDHAVVQSTIRSNGVYLRNLKRDVLPDLPRRRFTVVPVELAPRQRAAYDAAARSLAEDLHKTDEHGFRKQLTTFAARRSALLQLCSNPSSVLSMYNEQPAKLAALESLARRLVADGEKFIVWSFFTASIDAICNLLEPYGARRFDGKVADTAVRREAVRAFQEDEEVRVMVANPAAAGAGLTLTAARFAVYESFSNQPAHFLQSLDRIHRRGQERDVEYLVLLADDTIEQAEYSRLQRKERAAQDLLGDGHDSRLTREAMLDELLVTSPDALSSN